MIKVWIDSVQVIPTAIDPNVVVQGSGTVIHLAPFNLVSGIMEGWRVRWDGVGSWSAKADDWVQGALVDAEEPKQDIPSETYFSESDGATGTLSLEMGWEIEKQRRRGPGYEETVFVSGKRQRILMSGDTRPRYIGRRVFRTDSPVDEFDYDELRTFFDDHDGSEIPFTWTPPGGTSGFWRFRMRSVDGKMLPRGDREVTLVLEKVHGS